MYVANRMKMIRKGVVRRRSRMVVCNMQGKNIEKKVVRRRSRIVVYKGIGGNDITNKQGVGEWKLGNKL
jgi:hypothetical protein